MVTNQKHKLLRLKAFYCSLVGWWGPDEMLSAIHAHYCSAGLRMP